MQMKRKMIAGISVVSVAFAAYLFVVNDENNTPIENGTQNINELVYDYSVGNITNETASITSHQLIVTDSDESQLTYDLPEDEFFVSIAPYVDGTHP